MRELTFEFAGPPRGKGSVRGGRRSFYKDKKTEDYMLGLRTAASKAMAGEPIFTCGIELLVEAFFAPPPSYPRWHRRKMLEQRELCTKKPDWDNIGKMMDALEKVVFQNDKQIVDGRVTKKYAPRDYIRVTVREAPIADSTAPVVSDA